MRQADIFMATEGDKWLDRNRSQLGLHDPVCAMIEMLELRPTNILEVGCANGWRLEKLRERYGAQVLGVEPSRKAGLEAASLKVPVHQMTASTLPVTDPRFDLVIYGFCLYLTDPKDWFNIVASGDGVLAPGGHIIIHDFSEPIAPFAMPYKHDDRILSYHFDFASLWLAHPEYEIITRRVYQPDEMVTVIEKNGAIIPVRP